MGDSVLIARSGEDLAALIMAARAADAMREHHIAAVRAGDHVGRDNLIVLGAALIALGAAGALLRNGHLIYS